MSILVPELAMVAVMARATALGTMALVMGKCRNRTNSHLLFLTMIQLTIIFFSIAELTLDPLLAEQLMALQLDAPCAL